MGEAYVKTPPIDTAVFVNMPREPLGNLPKAQSHLDQLKHRSKANFGAIGRPQESAAVDHRCKPEHMEEPPDTTSTPATTTERDTQKADTQTNQPKENAIRFDEDAGEPKIEVC